MAGAKRVNMEDDGRADEVISKGSNTDYGLHGFETTELYCLVLFFIAGSWKAKGKALVD